MSIRLKLLLFFLGLVFFMGLFGVEYFDLSKAQRQVQEAENRRFVSFKLADELRQSSDDLTRMVRTYVVTGDPVYEQYFNEILAIRDGNAPRPESYDGIYWDFITALPERGDIEGSKESLVHRMRLQGFTELELIKLEEAKFLSDDLTNLENEAMAAVKGRFKDSSGAFSIEKEPDYEYARQLTHDMNYHKAKAAIMAPINEFYQLVEERTENELIEAVDYLDEHMMHSILIILGFILYCVISFFYFSRHINRPISILVRMTEQMERGSFNIDFKQIGSSEFSLLAKSFMQMARRINNTMNTLESLAITDSLTGAATSRLLYDRIDQAIAMAVRNKQSLGLLFMDLDRFKPINDQYGHHVGDLLLVSCVDRIQDTLRNSDTLARIGGDEFVVLLPEINGAEDAKLVSENIVKEVNKPFDIDGKKLSLGISIGYAIYPEDGSDRSWLLNLADQRMYEEKGRHQSRR
ncbi:MAG: diguanylate cyclase [Candidatus Sedimenticola sp. 20ELBAFRAG]